MRKQICIKVVTEDNHSVGSFRIEFRDEKQLDAALERALPLLAMHGILIPEHMEYEFKFKGIPVQKNANKNRSEHYQETGN